MGKSSPSPPPAPSPERTAAAQSAANVETAKTQAALNRLNQITPYGTVKYSTTGQRDPVTGIPLYQQKTQLSPAQQRILNQQQALQGQLLGQARGQFGRVAETLSQPFSFEGLPTIPGQEDLLGERQRVEDALFGSAMQRLDPRFQQEEERLRATLASQGIPIESEAFGREFTNLGQRQADLTNQALQSAIATGGAEQSRLFGLGQAGRQQAINEATFLRNLPLNEISALMSGTQVQGPMAAPMSQVGVSPTDVIGPTNLAYQGQLGAWQQGQQAQNQMMGNLFGLGGALGSAALMSSKEFKTKIDKESNITSKIEKLNIDRWSYKENLIGTPEGEHIGPYAEEFYETFGVGNGKSIPYVDAIGVCLGAIKELSAKVKELEAANG